MLPRRMRISKNATDNLKVLKGRTGVTPNLICRMALLSSLQEGVRGGMNAPELLGSEFNLPTLFGEYVEAFEALIRHLHGDLDAKKCASVVASHIDNGLLKLRKSKTLLDLLQHSEIVSELQYLR